ncbi:hypothetical protein JF66_08850 [Cryobacterium sp. MLB-32]|nr:hypothetical protein JF66_08850 [Cryobacterium sp. MLB-32]
MSSVDLVDIERYLAVELADDVREREGLVRLRIPGRMGEYAAGVRAREDDGTVTIVVGERPTRVSRRSSSRRSALRVLRSSRRAELLRLGEAANATDIEPDVHFCTRRLR